MATCSEQFLLHACQTVLILTACMHIAHQFFTLLCACRYLHHTSDHTACSQQGASRHNQTASPGAQIASGQDVCREHRLGAGSGIAVHSPRSAAPPAWPRHRGCPRRHCPAAWPQPRPARHLPHASRCAPHLSRPILLCGSISSAGGACQMAEPRALTASGARSGVLRGAAQRSYAVRMLQCTLTGAQHHEASCDPLLCCPPSNIPTVVGRHSCCPQLLSKPAALLCATCVLNSEISTHHPCQFQCESSLMTVFLHNACMLGMNTCMTTCM